MARVRFDSFDDVERLIRGCIQRGSSYVASVGITGQSDNSPGRIGTPPGRKEPREGRDEIYPTVVRHTIGEGFNSSNGVNDAQLVPQPLYDRPGLCYRAFQRIHWRFVGQLVGDCGEQSTGRKRWLGTGVV